MIGVKINTRMFALAREVRGISQVELAEKISTSQVNINRWKTEYQVNLRNSSVVNLL